MASASFKDSLNFLYDSYETNPFKKSSLNQAPGFSDVTFDQWNLINPASTMKLSSNRKVKTEKPVLSGKSTRDSTHKVPNKEELLQWLRNTKMSDRYRLFYIEDSCLVILLLFMFRKWMQKGDITFAIDSTDRNVSITRNFFDFEEIQKWLHLRPRSKSDISPLDTKKFQAEEELVTSLRVCDGEEFYDTLVFQEKFLENIERIIEIFELISDGSAFATAPKPYWCTLTGEYTCDCPDWFNPCSFQTIGTWITSNFEKAIWIRYFEENKPAGNKQLVTVDSRINLEYKQKLVSYWKQLKNENKIAVFSSAPELLVSLKGFELPKFEDLTEEKLSDEKYRLGLFYACFKNPHENVHYTQENVTTKIKTEFQDKNPEKFIENLLETSLENFGKITNVLSRMISQKIRSGLSDQYARELSNEDDKTQALKAKKKKSKKNKAKKKQESLKAETNLNSEVPNTEISSLNTQNGEDTKRTTIVEEEKKQEQIKIVSNSTLQPSNQTQDIIDHNTKINHEEEIGSVCFSLAQKLIADAIKMADDSVNDKDLSDKPSITSASVGTQVASKKNPKKKKKGKKNISQNQAETDVSNNSSTKPENKDNLTSEEIVSTPTNENDQNNEEVEVDEDLELLKLENKKLDKNRKKKQRKRLNKSKETGKPDSEERSKQNENTHLRSTSPRTQTSRDSMAENSSQENNNVVNTLWEMTTADNMSMKTSSQHEVNSDESERVNWDKLSCSTPSPTPSDMSNDENNQGKLTSEVINDLAIRLKRTLEGLEKHKDPISGNKNLLESKRRRTRTPNFQNDDSETTQKKTLSKFHHSTTTQSHSNERTQQHSHLESQYKSNSRDESKFQPQTPSQMEDGFIEVKPNKKKNQKAAPTEYSMYESRRGGHTEAPYNHKSRKTGCENHLKEQKTYRQAPVKTVVSTSVKESETKNEVQKTNKVIEAPQAKHSAPLTWSTSETIHKTFSDNSIKISPNEKVCHLEKSSESFNSENMAHDGSMQSVSQSITRANSGFNGEDSQRLETIARTPSNDSTTKTKKPLKLNPKTTPLSLKTVELDIEGLSQASLYNFVGKMFEAKLQEDIIEYVSNITQESNNMMVYRIVAFERLKFIVTNSFPSLPITAKLYGSCATGLALNTSDIDIAITGLGVTERIEVIAFLQMVKARLEQFGWIKSINPILTATMPVLKFEIDPSVDFTNITTGEEQVDEVLGNIIEQFKNFKDELSLTEDQMENSITINVDLTVEYTDATEEISHLGQLSTQFVETVTASYSSLYTVAMILKSFLHERGYLMYQGGLSSYSLIVLLTAYFKQFSDAGFSKALLGILDFFGKKFDPHMVGININLDLPFYQLPILDEKTSLVMLDMINFGKNIGHNSYKFNQIQKELSKMHDYLDEFRVELTKVLGRVSWVSLKTLDDLKRRKDPELSKYFGINLIEEIIHNSDLASPKSSVC